MGIKGEKIWKGFSGEAMSAVLPQLSAVRLSDPTSFIHPRSKHQKACKTTQGKRSHNTLGHLGLFSVDEGLSNSFIMIITNTYTPVLMQPKQLLYIFFTLSHSYPNIVLHAIVLTLLSIKLFTITRHKANDLVINVKRSMQMQSKPCIE